MNELIELCQHCGHEFPAGSDYCPNCGFKRQEINDFPSVTEEPFKMSRASLIAGIFSLLLLFIPFVSLVDPIPIIIAFVTGLSGSIKESKKWMAILGMLLALISAVIYVVSLIFVSNSQVPLLY